MTYQDPVPLPQPFSTIPRLHLLFPYPTPIEPLPRLEEAIRGTAPADATAHGDSASNDSKGAKARLFIKREDCNSGLAGGGNKVRKLEYVLADAVASGADTLVTEGGIQSNHMRQTAAAASKLGLKTVLLPRDLVPDVSQEYHTLGNVQLTHLLAAKHVHDASWTKTVEKLRHEGRKPYWIPAGASTHELGGLGYARCAFEVVKQERELGVSFDAIIVPTMSGSTLGGLAAGFKLVEKLEKGQDQAGGQGVTLAPAKKRRLIGVAAGPREEGQLKKLVLDIAKKAAGKIGLQDEDIGEEDFEIDERWSAGQYGRLDDRTAETIKLLATAEGIIADPVYSGKALTGLVNMVRSGELTGNILFVHTGGAAAVSAYPELR